MANVQLKTAPTIVISDLPLDVARKLTAVLFLVDEDLSDLRLRIQRSLAAVGDDIKCPYYELSDGVISPANDHIYGPPPYRNHNNS